MIIRANIYIKSDLWKTVRLAAFERNLSASKLVECALVRYLEKMEDAERVRKEEIPA